MALPRWLRALFAWEVYRDTGVWWYAENTVTGKRKAVRISPHYQPLDFAFLRDGDVVIDRGRAEIVGSKQWLARW